MDLLLIRFLSVVALLTIGAMAHGQSSSAEVPADSAKTGRAGIGAPVPTIDLLHMPSPYSYQHLGFFCKAEVQLNRLLPIPVMVRLGDVQRAEELDGKGPWHRR